MPRKFFTALMLGAGSLAGSLLYRRRAARRLERVDLYADDGSMASISDGSPDAERLLTLARELMALARESVSLADQIREAALLEGDFVLRSGRRSTYYLDKYRFGTRPDLLRALGEAIAAAVREHEPEAVRLAAPSWAPCRWRLRPRWSSTSRS